MPQTKEALVKQILESSGRIFNVLKPNIPVEVLSPDLSAAQLRVLLVLYTDGPAKMSAIATTLGIALPSATGIIDHLVKKDLVVRDADPQDRRLVICRLATAGQEILNKLWVSGESQIVRLLDGLTTPQLEQAAATARMLLDNLNRQTGGGEGA